jgi:PTS system mannose-specific IIA component
MIGILIVTQGGLAREFLAAAREIAGDPAQFEGLSLEWTDGLDEAGAKIHAAIDRLDTGDGVLVLADTFGATPCNVALRLRRPGRVEVISGFNLPMVVRLACPGNRREMGLDEAARWLQAKGRRSICVGSEVAAPSEGERPELAPVGVEVDGGDGA